MSRDRFADGVRAAARVLAANGIDARPYLDRLDDATRAEVAAMLGARPGLRDAADDLDRAASWLRLSGAPVSAATTELAADEARRGAAPKRPRPPGGGRGKGRRRGRG